MTKEETQIKWTGFGSISWNDYCPTCKIVTDYLWAYRAMKYQSMCLACFDKVFDRKSGQPR